MRLTERVYLVGSGASGFSLTHYSDCHIYLIDGGSESALIDAGTGMGIADVLESIRAHGFSPEAIHYLQEHLRNIEKLAGLNVDVFLPGHGCISLKDGQCHITEALDWLERCLIPPSLL